MSRRWRWLALLGALVGGGLTVCFRGVLLPPIARWLDVGGPPYPADAVLLLNGAVETRPFAAAALVQGGWARRVLLCTVQDSYQVEQGITLAWHEMDRRILLRCGVAEPQIVMFDVKASTTFDEAAAVAQYLDSSPETRLLVVTDGPHSRRARWILRQVLGDRAQQIAMVAAPIDDFQTENWWQSDFGFTYIVSEYLKLVFYAFRYSYLGYAVIGVAAVVSPIYATRRGKREL